MDIATQLQNLYQAFGEIPGISIELHKELIAINVINDYAEATLFLQGAQLSHYQRHGEAALIWLSPDCDFQRGTPLRGGIPICWPWFGNLNKNPAAIASSYKEETAAHGLVREQEWQLNYINNLSDGRTHLNLQLPFNYTRHVEEPLQATLSYDIYIGKTLELILTVKNISNKPLNYSTALHSYFAIADIHETAVTGLENTPFIDCLNEWQTSTENTSLKIAGETDRIYQQVSGEQQIIDSGNKRIITINSQDSNSCVVWNPWIEKSQRLNHFPDTGYKNMLCLETGKILDDSICLAPLGSHQLSLQIS